MTQTVHRAGEQRLQHDIVRVRHAVVHPQARLAIDDETSAPEVREVSRRTRLWDAERSVDVADTDLATSEQRQNPQARLIGHGLEQLLHLRESGGLHVGHVRGSYIRVDKYNTRGYCMRLGGYEIAVDR